MVHSLILFALVGGSDCIGRCCSGKLDQPALTDKSTAATHMLSGEPRSHFASLFLAPARSLSLLLMLQCPSCQEHGWDISTYTDDIVCTNHAPVDNPNCHCYSTTSLSSYDTCYCSLTAAAQGQPGVRKKSACYGSPVIGKYSCVSYTRKATLCVWLGYLLQHLVETTRTRSCSRLAALSLSSPLS